MQFDYQDRFFNYSNFISVSIRLVNYNYSVLMNII